MNRISWIVCFLFFWQNAFTQCLSGTYTVGNGGTYATLQSAVNDLDAKGSCGHIIFDIKPGSYTGKVVFPNTLNLSSSNTLTISGAKSSTTRFYDNPSSSSTNNYVFNIDGAGYITFKNLQIDRGTGSGSYATVVSFTNNTNNIVFDGCDITGIKSASAGNFNKTLFYFDNTEHQNIEIANCSLYGGSNGIYYERTGTVNKASDWVIKNNSFTDITEVSVYLTHLKNSKILQNNIQANVTSVAAQMGMYLSDCENKIEIKNNLIIQNRGTVFSLNKITNAGNMPAEVFNNVFNSVSTSNTGILITEVSGLLFYHNTVKQPNAVAAINCTQSTNLKIINNIVYGGLFSLSIDSVASIQASNYNNWYAFSGSAMFKSLTDTLKSVAAWTTYSGFDGSSISTDVYFTSNELNVTGENLLLNNKGTFLSDVKEDILGYSRNTSTPDMGAFEFDVFKTNAALFSTGFNIKGNTCPGYEEVKIKIINKGADTIKSVMIKLKVGDYKKDFLWTGFLPSLDTSDYITIDTFNIIKDNVYNFGYTLDLPNGMSDEYAGNDTFTINGIKTKMTGNYTVYGLKAQYDDLDKAITDIKARGFCDTVRLKLRNGKHVGSWDLSGIKQVSQTDYLVIESEYQDPQRCTLYTSNKTATHVLRFANTSGIKVRNLSVQKLDDLLSATLILLDNGGVNKKISLENNIFIGSILSPITLGGNTTSLIASNASSNNSRNDSIEIIGNTFYNNNAAIYFRRSANYQPEVGIVIKNNKFINQVYESIFLQNERGTLISGNYIETERDTFFISSGPWTSVELQNSNDVTISQNYVYRKNGRALRLEKDSGINSQALVINNVLVAETPLMYIQSKNFGFYFNTLRGIGSSGRLVVFTSAARQMHLRNNIIYHENGGRLFDSLNINFISKNNIYYTQANKITITDTSLVQLQARGGDSGSIFYNPVFFSPKDCHLLPDTIAYSVGKDTVGITIDKDGKYRDSLLTPGAYETTKIAETNTGVISITPDATCGYRPFITVNIKNYSSTDTVYNLAIKCTVNGGTVDSVFWQGKLPPGDTAKNIIIKKQVFDFDSLYTIKAWTSFPNYAPDINNADDTFTTTPRYYRFSGKYFVDGLNPDFNDPKEAIQALYKTGVCGDVTLELRKNRYVDTLLMNGMVKGMGNEYWINIKGESDDSTDVEITYTYSQPTHFELRNIKHVKLSNITLTTTSTYYVDDQTTLHINNAIGPNILESVWFGGISRFSGDSIKIEKSFFSEKSVLRAYNSKNLYINNNNFWSAKVALRNGLNTTNSNNILFVTDSLYYVAENGYKISNNHYFSEANVATMFLKNCGQGEISKNKVFYWNSPFGGNLDIGLISFDGTQSTAQAPVLVLNNIIYSNSSNGKVKGIFVKNSGFINIFHNSIMLDSAVNTVSEDMILETTGSKNIKVANNLFVKRTGPSSSLVEFMVRTDSFNTFSYFDNNYYSVNDSLPHQFSYYKFASQNISFQKWQDTSGFDLNSQWGKMPYFYPSKLAFREIIESTRVMRWSIGGTPYVNFHEPFLYLNQNYNWKERSSYNTGYNTDIFDKQRDTVNPSYGADEYVPQKNNAGIVGFDFSAGYPCQTSNNINIKLSNFGTDTLTSIYINGTIRDSTVNFYWTGKLAHGDTVSINLVNLPIMRQDSFESILWTESPNGLPDEYEVFDTLKGYIYTSMSGVYTLGKSSSDYTSFQAFLDDLKRRGVCGPVLLKVSRGKYEGQYVIPTINGSSDINTITVRSADNDSLSVVFSYSGFMNAFNAYTIYLNNAKYWRFENVGFINAKADPNAYARAVLMNNYVTDIEFNHCYLTCYTRKGGNRGRNSLMHIGPDYLEDGRIGTVKLTACFFDGGAYGLSATLGTNNDVDTGVTRFIVDSCVFFEQTNSVDVEFTKNFTFNNNLIYGKPDYGLRLLGMKDTLLIFNNKISDARVTGMYFTNTSKKGVQRVYNNEIIVKHPYGLTNSVGALYFNRVDGLEFVANSVHQNRPSYGSGFNYVAPWLLYVYRPYDLTFKNNLFTNKIGGRVFFADSVLSGTLTSDYNLWDAGDTIGQYNSTYAMSHSAWMTLTGMDSNTLIKDITYPDSVTLKYSNIDLKDKGIAIPYVFDDIDAVSRSTTPDIGCYEYADAADVETIGISPAKTCADTVEVKVLLKNKSTVNINAVEFLWSQNASTPIKGFVKTKIQSGDTMELAIGKVYIGKSNNTIKVTVTSVNYQYDLDTSNNSIQTTIVYNPGKKHTLSAIETGCINDTITLNPGAFVKYQWSTGDTTQALKVSSPQTVYFNLVDSNGCVSNDSVEVKFRAVQAHLLPPLIQGCTNDTITLNPGNFAKYQWSTGDTTKEIKVSQTQLVYFNLVDSNGCSNNDSIEVKFKLAQAHLLPSLVQGCTNDTITLNPGNFVKYQWSTGDTTKEIKISQTQLVYFNLIDSGGCKNNDSIYIQINAAKAHTLPNQKTGCSNDTISLDPGAFVKYQWSTGDTTRVIKVTGNQTISFNLIDSNGCSNNDSIEVLFEKGVDLGNDTTRCDLNSIILQVSGFSSYKWNTGATNSAITANKSGKYWLTATSAAGCISADTITVTVSVATPVIQKIGTTLVISNYNKNNTYNWLRNDTLIIGATDSFYVATNSGNFTVSATDSMGVCVVKSSQVQISLSVDYLIDNQIFEVYPNPTNKYLTISFKKAVEEATQVSVVDLVGREVYSELISPMAQNIVLNLEQLSAGMYQLIVVNKQLSAKVKIVISR
jgi:hypothetical protein